MGGQQPADRRRIPQTLQLSAASARSRERVLRLTLCALAAGTLVTPALGFGSSDPGPPEPTGLAVVQATATSITWSWSGEKTATSYRVFLDGSPVASSTSPQVTFDGLECGRSYVLAVQAVDADGRRSERAKVTTASAPCAPAESPQRARASAPAPPERPPAPAPELTPAPAPLPAPSQSSDETTQAQAPVAPDPTTQDGPPTIWQTAGVFVWHEEAVDPETLGRELKTNGFGWVAVQLHDGLSVDPVQDGWIRRFREASGGLPVGGWGVLRTQPVQEAQLVQSLLRRYGLDFYVADAEAEYKYSSDTGYSDARYARSRQFVDAFRSALPGVPAAVSSYCRADREDIDWQSWADGDFDFLPQAYVNDLGDYVTPTACANGARQWFQASAVHPTIGMYESHDDQATPSEYARLLEAAHTVGFSVYLAETQQDPQAWNELGQAISELGIARVGDGPLASEPAGASEPDPAFGQSGLR